MSDAIIKTGSWFARLPDDHIKVGISRGTPRGLKAGYRQFRKLAPGPWFQTVGDDEYDRLYQAEILGVLNASETLDEILALSRGAIPVMCCFEKAPGPPSCHRFLVSEWFQNQLGITVPEVGYESLSKDHHPLMMNLTRLKSA